MKWLRNILKGVSLCAALFVFQACYGAPQVPEEPEDEVVEQNSEENGEGTKAEEEAVVAQAE